MEKSDNEKIISRYNQRLEVSGYSAETLGWTKNKSNLRFSILAGHWDLEGSSLLDYGCGFGNLYEFLAERKVKVSYTGIDINPKLIELGKKQFPGADLRVGDLSECNASKKYDFVFSSGVHNFLISDNWKFIEETMAKFWEVSNRGFALNFLSSTADKPAADLFYAQPDRVLSLALKFSKRALLRHDYMPFEFSIFVDHQDQFSNSTVFKEYEMWVKK